MPHARVTSIDASAALAMPGVHGVLTADEVTNAARRPRETILTNEPMFVGHPILAVAADTEELASDALEQIKVDVRGAAVHRRSAAEPVPRRDRMRARTATSRTWRRRAAGPSSGRRKTSRAAGEGQLPMGAPVTRVVVRRRRRRLRGRQARARRDVRDGRPRRITRWSRARAMAYWQNGKCYLYGSTQSQSFPIPGIARTCSASSPRISSTSPSSAAAASARRAAPIR